MSDNLRRYCAIRDALQQLAPKQMTGNQIRHLRTLAALVSGIVGSGKVSLPAVAGKVPDGKQRDSRVKRFERFLKNERVTQEAFFLPFAEALLASLPEGPLVLVMDTSQLGRGCLALVVSVRFKKRALPIGWLVVEGNKGHVSEERHKELLAQVALLVPEGRSVLFLGDGEFDGCALLCALRERDWDFVCRTARNVQLEEAQFPGCPFSFADLGVEPGECIEIPDTSFTIANENDAG